jgi:hypothetical protein
MIRLLTVLAFSFNGLAFGEFRGSLADRSPTVAPDLIVLEASQVAESDRIAVIGNKAVINKSASSKYASALAFAPSLFVVQDPITGKYGTSDGGIVIRFSEGENLAAIAADYGMDIKHEFSALPMGVLMPFNTGAAASYLSSLRADFRVVTADLDVNFNDLRAH